MNNIYITVLTLTYNRAKTLPKCYDQLRKQKYNQFEWLIFDDGSEDNTETLVEQWKQEKNSFKIIYIKEKHIGHARAWNRAVQFARGKYLIWCDSNKYLTDNALESINIHLNEVDRIQEFAGISGLRAFSDGTINGGNIYFQGKKWIDASSLEETKYNLGHEKAQVIRVELLRKYPMPEFSGEEFVTEAVFFHKIAAEGFKIRWYNEVYCIGDFQKGGMTLSGANSFIGRKKNFQGYLYYVRQEIEVVNDYDRKGVIREFLKTEKYVGRMSLNYLAEDLHMKKSQVIKLLLNWYWSRLAYKVGLKKVDSI